MKSLILISTLLFFIQIGSIAQTDAVDSTSPVIVQINREDLSGLNLDKIKLKDHPERDFYQKTIFRGKDLSVFILSSETAENDINSFPFEEFVIFMNGKAKVSPAKGQPYTFLPNDHILVPKGFSGVWTNYGGNDYHLELSVIANNRTEASKFSEPDKPFLLDKELLAGIGITKVGAKNYKDVLYNGIELVVTTESEQASTKQIVSFPSDQFVKVINGKVTIKAKNGDLQTFYSGDVFIMPKGFSGTWTSEGADLFRTIRVTSVM